MDSYLNNLIVKEKGVALLIKIRIADNLILQARLLTNKSERVHISLKSPSLLEDTKQPAALQN